MKLFVFEAPGTGWRPELTICGEDGSIRSCWPTHATYARFVRLANSGDYHVAIVADASVGWSLMRRAPREYPRIPAACSSFDDSENHQDNRRRAQEQMDGLRRGMGLDE
jgi:hypothetical protein